MRGRFAAIALSGCQLVFPLDTPPDVPPDAGPPTATLHWQQSWAENDADFMPRVKNGPVVDIPIVVRHADGTELPVTLDGDGNADLGVPLGEPYALRVGDKGLLEYQTDVRHFELRDLHSNRPDALPVSDNTKVHFDTVFPGGEIPTIFTTGVWSVTGPPAFNIQANTLDWTGATPVASPIALLDQSHNDRMYIASLAAVMNYFTIDFISDVGVTLLDAKTTEVHLTTLDHPARDLCTTLALPIGTEHARLVPLAPNFGAPVTNFTISTPVSKTELGPLVASLGVVVGGDHSPQDVTLADVRFMNPFPNTHFVASMAVARVRTLTVPGTIGIDIAAGTTTVVDMPDHPTCPSVTTTTPIVGIAGGYSLAGQAIPDDTATLHLPLEGSVVATWSLDAGHRGDFTAVSLEEIGATAALPPKTELRVRRQVLVTGSTATFDTDLFADGNKYILRFDVVAGIPGAATGDYTRTSFPYGVSTAWSPTFVVKKP